MESREEVKEENQDECSECESKNVLIKKAKKSYCRACWRYHCEFKFRKRLFEIGRPTKGSVGEVFRPAEPVLIVYDGSPSSVALINLALNAILLGKNLLRDGYSPSLPFPFKFIILVVLESEMNGSPGVVGRQKKHLHSLLKWTQFAQLKSEGIPFHLIATCLEMSIKEYHPPDADNYMRFKETPMAVRLVEAVTDNQERPEDVKDLRNIEVDRLTLPFNESLDYHLMEIRRSLKSKTEDKDFIAILKKNLVHTIVDDLGISKIVLPEDQTSLAVKMFSMMSLGRGLQVADEMSFTTSNPNGKVTCRPLIDFSDDDLRSYIDTLEEPCTEGILSKSGKRKMKIDSVERQCDDFIVNLQKGYPATVSTLTRIGGKLQSSGNQTPTLGSGVVITSCQFCKRRSDSVEPCLENISLCYGCQHFLTDVHPDKKGLFRNLLTLKTNPTASP